MAKPTFILRRTFEALLGRRVMAYLMYLRPLEWPIMTAHFLLGTLLAVGIDLPWGNVLFGWFVFVILMNGGTLAINSAFDKDEGDVGYLKSPPEMPQYLPHISTAMLVAAFLLCYMLPFVFAWATAACVLMSVLYSVPPARLKSRAGWDLLINMLGYGLLTPLAGWGLTGQHLTSWFMKVCIGFAFLFGSLYPATQVYQVEEDAARGDRTLVITLGIAKSLIAALLLQTAAHSMFIWAAVERMASVSWIFVSLISWSAVIIRWLMRWRTLSQSQHEKRMYWLLVCWAVTEAALLWTLWPRSV